MSLTSNPSILPDTIDSVELDVINDIIQQMPDACVMSASSAFMNGLTVFLLACFVGYYVVWRVTPALHSPLMAVTNAISSVVIVGAILAAGIPMTVITKILGFIAVILAAINIFGGFIVTGRMLNMFSAKKK